MNTFVQDNRCLECKKLFCCSSCRNVHVKKKHPKSKTDTDCQLCRSEKLPLERFQDSKFLCHLVIRHLPLICLLCGELYRNSYDLENFGECSFWRKPDDHDSSVREPPKKLPVQATPSPIVKSISCPAACQQGSVSTDSEYHTLQSLTSPPVLMRNTSTPMHVGVSSQISKPQFKTPKAPTFFLKTPKTPSAKNNKSGVGNETIDENPSPSLFYSATSQLLLTSKDINSDSTPFGSLTSGSRSLITGDTPSRSTAAVQTPNRLSEEGAGLSREFFRASSGRVLEVMEEQEEQLSDTMDLTGVQDHLFAASETGVPDPPSIPVHGPAKDAPKRVRFSDQHQLTVDPVSDSEEFYEAREMPSAKSKVVNESNDSKSEARMVQENEENSDKENLSSPEEKVFQTPSGAPPTTTSSRVVMMVVVENGFDVSTSNLVPLINSSLQQLERNPSTEGITSSMSNISNPKQSAPGGLVRSVSTVDSFTASSTTDYYSTRSCPDLRTPLRNQTTPASSENGGGGILSAMAQAMRYAFRGLPGTSKGSPPRVPIESRATSSSSGSLASPSSYSSIATSLLRRPGKRSRDPANDPTFGHSRELRPSRNETGTSPVAKRPRSWHKIRGRDPIARMRRDTPPQGVSSETQQFQQGSLSAGDTVLPLPSRAHQSTQTD